MKAGYAASIKSSENDYARHYDKPDLANELRLNWSRGPPRPGSGPGLAAYDWRISRARLIPSGLHREPEPATSVPPLSMSQN